MNSPFDERKYKRLLKGLELTELLLSDFLTDNIDFRLDAEYFSKKNIELNNQLDRTGFIRINDFAFVTDGIHSSIDYSEESSIKLVSATTPRENYFDFSRNVFISKKAHLLNPRTALKIRDIVISTVGTIGNCAVIKSSDLPANSDRHVGIIRIKNKRFLPNYVSTFLLSKYGRFQTFRESTGNVQLNLFIYKIKTLKIAALPLAFQKKIEKIVELAHSKLEQSQSLYCQAEELLLKNIGLKDFKPSKKASNVKSFKESFLKTGRLDAEYYQPKYDFIESTFDKFDRVTLSDIVSYPISSGITPKAGGADYTDAENGIPFIRAVDLVNGEVNANNFNYIKPNVHNGILKRTQLKKDDVLFSIAGTVGRCAIFQHEFEANINQAVAILRFNEAKVLKLYLIAFFNSYIGKEFVSKYARQGLQTNLNLEEVGALKIPVIDLKIQRQITAVIKESFSLRKESEKLLDKAKEMAEREIEGRDSK